MSQHIRPTGALVAGLAIVLGAACTHGAADKAAMTVGAAPGSAETITVLAAASLNDAFNEIGKTFEAANPSAHVKFSYDAPAALASRANSGAPVDVFASADDANMLKVTAAGNAPRPQTFARDALEIVVRKGNPMGIHTLADFNRSNVAYVLCAAGLACGTYGRQMLDQVDVTRPPGSAEADPEAVVDRVTSGKADAGIVYQTDVGPTVDAEGVAIPPDQNVVATYPIAVLRQSPHPDVARAFVDYVLSPPGQATLAKYGFLPAK